MKEPSKYVKRWIGMALTESLRSDYGRVSIGAVITDGNYVVSRGCNSLRTHPRQAQYNHASNRSCNGSAIHAEVEALVKARDYDLSGCTIFVARFDRRGKLANCKPCVACQYGLRDSGIQRCYYTDTDGIKEMIIGNV